MAMDLAYASLAVLGLLLAGVIKGTTGLGYASCALPFLVMALGLKAAMALVVLPTMATNITLALGSGHLSETLRRFGPLYLAMLPGLAAGIWLLSWVEQQSAVKLLGGVMIGYVTLALAKPALRLPPRLETPLQVPTGFCNGLIAGLTGAQVMPLFPYVMALHLDKTRTVQAINLAVLIATFGLCLGLATAGLLSTDGIVYSALAIIPALIGAEIGARVRAKIPEDAFRRVVLFTLLLIGTLLLLR